MSDEQKYTIQGLDEYIRQGEPQQRERSEAFLRLSLEWRGCCMSCCWVMAEKWNYGTTD